MPSLITLLVAILLAGLVYWLCLAIGLPAIVAVVAAILVLIGVFGTDGRRTRL
jgi:hypothetical protein